VRINAEFVTSAARLQDFPSDGRSHIALVGRSNVGKSSLINAVTRSRVARTGAAPGTTRLANVYRVARERGTPFYLVDLPGYGFARGGSAGFDELTAAYFGRKEDPARMAALLLIDARHVGLERDRTAWMWLRQALDKRAVVATKMDKLARGERIRALNELESAYDDPVVPFSAATGEGLDQLWKQIERLANSRKPSSPHGPQARPPRTNR
jgi:GTP-binding protein